MQPTTSVVPPIVVEGDLHPQEDDEANRATRPLTCCHTSVQQQAPVSSSGGTWCGCSTVNPSYVFINSGRSPSSASSSGAVGGGQQQRYHYIPNPSLRPSPITHHTAAFTYTPPPPIPGYPAPMPNFPPPPVLSFRLPPASAHTHSGGPRSPVWWSYPSMAGEPVATSSAHHAVDSIAAVASASPSRPSTSEPSLSGVSSSPLSPSSGSGSVTTAQSSYGAIGTHPAVSTASGTSRPVDGRSTMPAAIARSFMRMHPLHQRLWSAQQRSQVFISITLFFKFYLDGLIYDRRLSVVTWTWLHERRLSMEI